MKSIHDESSVGSPEQLARLDLNLLVVFDALARERNATRASARLGVSQSAVSHALSRLRELLGDPLFVRGRGGMMLTPRAETLAVPLRSGLSTLGRALVEPTVFEPSTAKRSFRIASPDLFDVLAVPPVLARIRSEGPGIDVSVTPLAASGLSERLAAGELDVAVMPRIDGGGSEAVAAGGLLSSRLIRDRFVCFVRRDHPVLARGRSRRSAARRLPLATFIQLSHALVSSSGEGLGFVDEVLAERGLRRRIALRVPHFYSALTIVMKSDLVVTAPRALLHASPESSGVTTLECPLPLPRHSVNLVWHERYAKDPGHAWFRKLLTDVCRKLQHELE